MSEPTQEPTDASGVVVFGIDDAGKPHASFFKAGEGKRPCGRRA